MYIYIYIYIIYIYTYIYIYNYQEIPIYIIYCYQEIAYIALIFENNYDPKMQQFSSKYYVTL